MKCNYIFEIVLNIDPNIYIYRWNDCKSRARDLNIYIYLCVIISDYKNACEGIQNMYASNCWRGKNEDSN